MNKNFYFSMFFPIILSIFISIFFIPFSENPLFSYSYINSTPQSPNKISSKFLWPTPGYTKITSKFGYRKSLTVGASSYHGGIDVAAPQNSSILAVDNGTVSFVGWNGANGYTVTLTHKDGYTSTYGHISPKFCVSQGEYVYKGQKIATVGPKYIDRTSFTTYIEASTGKYTNGATTGPHLHFVISKNGKKIDPESIF